MIFVAVPEYDEMYVSKTRRSTYYNRLVSGCTPPFPAFHPLRLMPFPCVAHPVSATRSDVAFVLFTYLPWVRFLAVP